MRVHVACMRQPDPFESSKPSRDAVADLARRSRAAKTRGVALLIHAQPSPLLATEPQAVSHAVLPAAAAPIAIARADTL